MNLSICHAGRTDRGLVRDKNEDRWVVDSDMGLYIVSDGIGGQLEGALASRIVVETLPALLQEVLRDGGDLTESAIQDEIRKTVVLLSRQLHQQTEGQPGLEGMGATVVAAVVREDKAAIVHMGDSRAYLMTGGDLKRLTRDHSIVQLLIDHGEITASDIASHPARGCITRHVGMEGEPLPDLQLIDLKPDDRLLLCTDGLTDMLKDAEIEDILGQQKRPRSACDALIDAALNHGGKDNVTVVVVDLCCGTDSE